MSVLGEVAARVVDVHRLHDDPLPHLPRVQLETRQVVADGHDAGAVLIVGAVADIADSASRGIVDPAVPAPRTLAEVAAPAGVVVRQVPPLAIERIDLADVAVGRPGTQVAVRRQRRRHPVAVEARVVRMVLADRWLIAIVLFAVVALSVLLPVVVLPAVLSARAVPRLLPQPAAVVDPVLAGGTPRHAAAQEPPRRHQAVHEKTVLGAARARRARRQAVALAAGGGTTRFAILVGVPARTLHLPGLRPPARPLAVVPAAPGPPPRVGPPAPEGLHQAI